MHPTLHLPKKRKERPIVFMNLSFQAHFHFTAMIELYMFDLMIDQLPL
jgi:hypothetical protein